jgi:hypothetical protein
MASILSVLLSNTEAVEVQGQTSCYNSSCGHLQHIQYPFRMQGDRPGCGFPEYELVCVDSKAIIHINTGRYFVTNISYTDSTFWVVDANLDNSSCPIPASYQRPYDNGLSSNDGSTLLGTDTVTWATFVNCSVMLRSDVISFSTDCCSGIYNLVDCQSMNSSFVYVFTSTFFPSVRDIKPSCRYLSTIPLGNRRTKAPNNATFEDVVKFMRDGFAVQFPYHSEPMTHRRIINRCLNVSMR